MDAGLELRGAGAGAWGLGALAIIRLLDYIYVRDGKNIRRSIPDSRRLHYEPMDLEKGRRMA